MTAAAADVVMAHSVQAQRCSHTVAVVTLPVPGRRFEPALLAAELAGKDVQQLRKVLADAILQRLDIHGLVQAHESTGS